jgi:C4-dicarboxylate-specific signal transduction histidine kinase
MNFKEAAFMGKITAAMTHEMKNVLAVIKETNGLMEDLLATMPEGAWPHRERMIKAIASIQKQVQRGSELSTRLNSFAHSPDRPVTQVDLSDLVDHILYLCRRFARLKEVTLEIPPASQKNIVLVTSPLHLQMALFLAIEAILHHLAPGQKLQTEISQTQDGMPQICFIAESGQGADGLPENELQSTRQCPELQKVMANLKGHFQWQDPGPILSLTFPKEITCPPPD